ncbi:reverse transcriptase domain-containing protein [Tanacetum coccineum]|uniref:Reverse transcriptase domain-containing protein n=1 Tax=Tanacetum coccineum TaxID=301880 RepID=A0ABQ5FJK7_9ASTR
MIDTSYPMEVDTLNEYAVLDRKLDTPYPMEVDTPYSAIDQNRRNSKIQEVSQHSESRTPNVREEHQRGRRSGRSRSISRSPERTSVFFRIRHDRSELPRHRTVCKGRRDGGVFDKLGAKKRVHPHTRKAATRVPAQEERNSSLENVTMKERVHEGEKYSPKSSIEEDYLSQPWVCEEIDPFTPRIRYFDFPKKTRMPNNVKTYDESEDPEDHLKIFQAAAKVERWAMPTWCHMFNSTLTRPVRVWFDDLPTKSVDSYDDLKKAFLAHFLQQKKCIKDLVKIYHIKQREGESTEDFMQRFKAESSHVKGASECMRISGFMHGIPNPELIKRERWQLPTRYRRKQFKRGSNRKLGENKILKEGEISGINKDQSGDAGKLSHIIKELKQGNEKDQPKAAKKEETSRNDKPLAILMVQPWQRVGRQRITQSFSPNLKISFPPLGDEDEAEGPMIIEAEI